MFPNPARIFVCFALARSSHAGAFVVKVRECSLFKFGDAICVARFKAQTVHRADTGFRDHGFRVNLARPRAVHEADQIRPAGVKCAGDAELADQQEIIDLPAEWFQESIRKSPWTRL